jgi:hypothetical protein
LAEAVTHQVVVGRPSHVAGRPANELALQNHLHKRSLQHLQSSASLPLPLSESANRFGVISMHSSQKDARNREHGFALGHRNVNFLQDENVGNCNDGAKSKNEDCFTSRPIELECETTLTFRMQLRKCTELSM